MKQLKRPGVVFSALLFSGFLTAVFGQDGPTVVSISPPQAIAVKAGQTAKTSLSVTVSPGYHANSSKPADVYLIPFSLKWDDGPLETVAVVYPRPKMLKLNFSAKAVSVFTGTFDVETQFKAAAAAAPGETTLKGKLHYQACDDKSCLPPRTLAVSVPVQIIK